MKFCWHKWSRWSEAYRYGHRDYQVRTCVKCGKVVTRCIGVSKAKGVSGE